MCSKSKVRITITSGCINKLYPQVLNNKIVRKRMMMQGPFIGYSRGLNQTMWNYFSQNVKR